jgi:DNA polymerase Pol2
MYASVIVSYNLSRSTYTKNKNNSFAGSYLNKNAYFLKKPLGFVPTLLQEIIDKRRQVKQEYNKNPNPITKARSNAYKLLANAAYGYQGFFGGRYYSIEAASSTAYFARENIKQAIDKIKKSGYSVIYSDTDSIAFELGKHNKKQVLELLSKVNSKLPGIMELDLEGFFKRGIWVTKRTGDFGAKKKYALIDDKNKIKIRGFETVRRDWCPLARTTQNHILQLILKTGNEKLALTYIKKIIKQIKNREIPLSQLIIRTQLKKPISEYKSIPPHVTIAKKMQEQDLPVDIGMLIEYYIAESENGKKRALVRERAKMPNEPGKYDIDYYLNNQIIPAVGNIFEVFNINLTEFVNGKKQKKLFEF